MKEVKRFWPFMKADYRAAERYLEAQSRKGLHIHHIDSYGIKATYEKGEPRNLKYSVDYYSGEYEEKKSYIKLLEDAGWNHVADMDMYMIFSGLALYVVGRLPEDLLPKKVGLILGIFLMLLTVVGFIGFMFVLSSDL